MKKKWRLSFLGMATAAVALLSSTNAHAADKDFLGQDLMPQAKVSATQNMTSWEDIGQKALKVGAVGLGVYGSYLLYSQNKVAVDSLLQQTVDTLESHILAPAYGAIQNFFQTPSPAKNFVSGFLKASVDPMLWGQKLAATAIAKTCEFGWNTIRAKQQGAPANL